MRLVNADGIKEYVSYVIKDSDELLTSSVVRKAVLGIIDTMALYGLVTCEDCKHYLDGGCGNVDSQSPSKNLMGVKPNWFCADGERGGTDDRV